MGAPPVGPTLFPGTWMCAVSLTITSPSKIVITGTLIAVDVAVSSVAAYSYTV